MMEGNERNHDASGPDDRRGSFSLRRWSQRKHEAAREAKAAAVRRETDARPAPAAPAHAGPAHPASPHAARPHAAPARAASPHAASSSPASATLASSRIDGGAAAPVIELPSIESLTADSDFAPFMRAGVDPDLRREALKKLLHDARFNVMDGLDVYIDDYTKTKPIAPSLARELAARLHPRLDGEEASSEQAPAAAGNPQPQAPQDRADADTPAKPGLPVTNDELAERAADGAALAPDAPRERQEGDRVRPSQQENE